MREFADWKIWGRRVVSREHSRQIFAAINNARIITIDSDFPLPYFNWGNLWALSDIINYGVSVAGVFFSFTLCLRRKR